MKNVQIITGKLNATFGIFQATDKEFAVIFPDGRDIELDSDLVERVGQKVANRVVAELWNRPICKRDAMGVHGTLFHDSDKRRDFLPRSRREGDWSILPIPSSSDQSISERHATLTREIATKVEQQDRLDKLIFALFDQRERLALMFLGLNIGDAVLLIGTRFKGREATIVDAVSWGYGGLPPTALGDRPPILVRVPGTKATHFKVSGKLWEPLSGESATSE